MSWAVNAYSTVFAININVSRTVALVSRLSASKQKGLISLTKLASYHDILHQTPVDILHSPLIIFVHFHSADPHI